MPIVYIKTSKVFKSKKAKKVPNLKAIVHVFRHYLEILTKTQTAMQDASKGHKTWFETTFEALASHSDSRTVLGDE